MGEEEVIILTALLNFITAFFKLVLGIVFSFSTLVSDSIQSFLDFFTDLISLITNKIGKKRANKTYPFGYGQVYYLSNLFTGLLLFFIGLFIVYQIFVFNEEFVPNMFIFFALLIVLSIKCVVVILLQRFIKNSKNELFIESYKESRVDFISTCVVLVILIITFFDDYIPDYINVDKIGSFCMAIYVFYTSFKMIISNRRGIFINYLENEETKNNIMDELKKYNEFKVQNIKMFKFSNYYVVFLRIDVNDNIKIKDFLKLEKTIKMNLKSFNRLIKYVDIDVL